MNEVESLIVRRVAIEMKKRKRSRGHAKIIKQLERRENVRRGLEPPPCTSIE
jgi:hypothetical protein